MSYDMKFAGRLEFGDRATIDDAFAAAEELVEEEAPDFQEMWESDRATWFRLEGTAVVVDIDLGAPGDWWFTLEALVESFADLADSGRVDSWYDDEENESYGPDIDDGEIE